MDVDDRQRHALYRQFETVLGTEHADTVMALLPPVGWADVATRADLAALEGRLEARIDAVETTLGARIDIVEAGLGARIDRLDTRIDRLDADIGRQLADLRAEFHQALRQQVWAILGVLVVAIAVSEALGRLS